MFLDLINLEKVRRAIIYSGMLLATLLVQSIILSRIPILGVRAFIIPITVVAIGFFEGGVWGGVFGLIAGIFTDMSLDGSAVMMTIVFPVIGFFSGALPMFYFNRKLMSFVCFCLAGMLITAVCQMAKYILFTDTNVWALLLTAALQVFWAVPFIFLVYFLNKKLVRIDLKK